MITREELIEKAARELVDADNAFFFEPLGRKKTVVAPSDINKARIVVNLILAALRLTPSAASALMDGTATVVPNEPTAEMMNAAIDVDSFRLGDISPLGFRESPQRLLARCYRAAIAAGSYREKTDA